MAFSDMFAASQNWDLQQRVTIAILRRAPEIVNQGEAAALADRRLAFSVARAPQTFTQGFTLLLAASDITNASSDADIYARVSQMWAVMAGEGDLEPEDGRA